MALACPLSREAESGREVGQGGRDGWLLFARTHVAWGDPSLTVGGSEETLERQLGWTPGAPRILPFGWFGSCDRIRVCHREFWALSPARFASSRFPGKSLARIADKSMLQHVWERACMARYLSKVIIATDDERIADEARSFKAIVRMTRADHATGTDRVAEAAVGRFG